MCNQLMDITKKIVKVVDWQWLAACYSSKLCKYVQAYHKEWRGFHFMQVTRENTYHSNRWYVFLAWRTMRNPHSNNQSWQVWDNWNHLEVFQGQFEIQTTELVISNKLILAKKVRGVDQTNKTTTARSDKMMKCIPWHWFLEEYWWCIDHSSYEKGQCIE